MYSFNTFLSPDYACDVYGLLVSTDAYKGYYGEPSEILFGDNRIPSVCGKSISAVTWQKGVSENFDFFRF